MENNGQVSNVEINKPQVAENSRVPRKRTREDIRAYRSVDYSGFFERMFARGVDFLIVVGFCYLLYRKWGLGTSITGALIFDLVMRVTMTYFLGGTPGKLLMGIRVISRCSGKLSIWQVIEREIFKYISGLFINCGYLSIAGSRRKRAWHDIAACTAVTSGGREEAEYARDIYKEKPEKWYFYISIPAALIIVGVLAVAANKGASHLLYDGGMVGFTRTLNSKGNEFVYMAPSADVVSTGAAKQIIQAGDIDGDGRHEIFRERVDGERTIIGNMSVIGREPVNGEISVAFDKPVIQYRFLDINGDKKDELAVLFEDKVLGIYTIDIQTAEEGSINSVTPVEIGAFGPVEFGKIAAVNKGKPAENVPWKLYILGDGNRLEIVSMDDGKVINQSFDLPGGYNLTFVDMGRFDDNNYLVTLTDSGKVVFYKYDGETYKESRVMDIPLKGRVSMAVKDINMDGKNEIFVSSPQDEDRPYPVLAAYDVTDKDMRITWDGGRFYKLDDTEISLAMDEGMDADGDGSFEAFMVSQENTQGRYKGVTLVIFESDKYMMRANNILRALSLSKQQK